MVVRKYCMYGEYIRLVAPIGGFRAPSLTVQRMCRFYQDASSYHEIRPFTTLKFCKADQQNKIGHGLLRSNNICPIAHDPVTSVAGATRVSSQYCISQSLMDVTATFIKIHGYGAHINSVRRTCSCRTDLFPTAMFPMYSR